jgi:hypothetical protein
MTANEQKLKSIRDRLASMKEASGGWFSSSEVTDASTLDLDWVLRTFLPGPVAPVASEETFNVRNHLLASLFEEFLCTLEVNRLRGVICTSVASTEPQFEKLLASYRDRFKQLVPDGYKLASPNVYGLNLDKVYFT